jgi:glutamine synthetase adenylyltransferase
MDSDLYELNLIFLQKAREWLASGQDHKAQVLLGLNAEAAAWLKQLPIGRLQSLAASNLLSYTLRVPPQVLQELAEAEAMSDPVRWHLLASTIQGSPHDDHAA